jgi:iron(III) transport system ATP-binding protein
VSRAGRAIPREVSAPSSTGSPLAVEVAGAAKAFGATEAVRAVDLAVARGELFTVLGPSGCGKTTLLRLIAGFERPDAGEVSVGGRVVAGEGEWVPPEDRRIGMVFQDFALFPHLPVERNVAFGLPRRERGGRRGVGARARSALELVGLQHKADRLPHELSGGERQRVALARALAPEPELVLLDEPFSSLDATLRGELRREVELILRDAEATAILVTHDQEEALTLGDRLAVMRGGLLVQVGRPEEVYAHPADRWAAGFLGEVNVVAGVRRSGGAVETWLGVFDAAGAGAGSVHLAVRPEQLELRPDRHGNAEVVERDFRGHDVLYRLRHEVGGSVLVQLPSLELYEVGERVQVRPARAAVGSVVD